MRVALDQNDREFLKQLHRLGTSATVQEICSYIGVTATAVRQRLARLQASRLISREAERIGRGRPRHVYKITELGQKELGDNYSDLALLLWRELSQIPEPTIRDSVVNRIRDTLIERYRQVVGGETVSERLDGLQSALADRGFDVEIDETGQLPVLRENNCPYPELANSDPKICELEQEVFEQVLGVPVTLARCIRDGHNCCEFVAGKEAGV